MSFWIPKPTGKAPGEEQLSEKERLVLSRIDGSTSVTHLNFLPGLSAPVVERILDRFVEMGLVEPSRGSAEEVEIDDEARPRRRTNRGFAPLMPQPPPMRFVESADEPEEPEAAPSPFAEDPGVEEFVDDAGEQAAAGKDEVAEPADEAPAEAEEAADKPPAGPEEPADVAPDEAEEPVDVAPDEAEEAADETKEPSDETEEQPEEEAPDEEEQPAEEVPDEVEEAAEGVKEDVAEAEPSAPPSDIQLNNYRRLYETQLKHLDRDARVQLARTTTEELLYALCYDEFPGVIAGILDNPTSGLQHARMIARYHGKAMGIEHLVQRARYLQDPLIQRHLLRNRVTPDAVLKRLLRLKPLMQLFKINFSREISDGAKRVARDTFRSKFQTGSAEECIALVFGTEGRCLQQLSGVPLDEAFTALFVKRSINSMQLVQSLARHAATPPKIIVHLWRQPLVKRQTHLRNMLLKHPNCPGELKRSSSR